VQKVEVNFWGREGMHACLAFMHGEGVSDSRVRPRPARVVWTNGQRWGVHSSRECCFVGVNEITRSWPSCHARVTFVRFHCSLCLKRANLKTIIYTLPHHRLRWGAQALFGERNARRAHSCVAGVERTRAFSCGEQGDQE
jgi:hypothetical protein